MDEAATLLMKLPLSNLPRISVPELIIHYYLFALRLPCKEQGNQWWLRWRAQRGRRICAVPRPARKRPGRSQQRIHAFPRAARRLSSQALPGGLVCVPGREITGPGGSSTAGDKTRLRPGKFPASSGSKPATAARHLLSSSAVAPAAPLGP